MDEYIKNVIFKNNQQLYQELVNLSERIKNTKIKNKPFIIEFLGSCRSGKTSSIELITDVLQKNGLVVNFIDEEKVELTKNINNNRNAKMQIDSLDYTNNIIEEKMLLFDSFAKENSDIIIFDRGINDEFVWLNNFGGYLEKLNDYDKKLANRKVDLLIILTCDVEISLQRKYLNSLSILPSKWTNYETLKGYLESLEIVEPYFNNHAKNIFKIDSSDKDKTIIALDICKKIVEVINN